jgi:hypothetical protein
MKKRGNEMTIHEKLMCIQKKLKAPKNQFNAFGKYKYRSCEDILEAIKPMLDECYVIIDDDLIQVGDRYYVRATVSLTDGKEAISVTAFAREEESKKGMDASQITGTASSYARKYGLNGLFLIDDTKDADTQPPKETKKKEDDVPEHLGEPPQAGERKILEVMIQKAGIDREIVKEYLASVGWVTEKEGKLSMTTLSEKNVKTILSKWESFMKQVETFSKREVV